MHWLLLLLLLLLLPSLWRQCDRWVLLRSCDVRQPKSYA
jgi:hypothetical protein